MVLSFLHGRMQWAVCEKVKIQLGIYVRGRIYIDYIYEQEVKFVSL